MTIEIYNTIQHVSNKNKKKFESFSEVLDAIMTGRRENQSYIAQKTGKDKKQISDYVNGKTTPFNKTQQEMAEALGVILEQTDNGDFILFDPLAQDTPTVEEMIQEYGDRKAQNGFSHNERDLLLRFLLDNAESLSKGIRRLIEIEKNDE